MNEVCPVNGCERVRSLEKDVEALKTAVSEHNVMFAKIKTKLNGILWGVGVIGTAIIGVPVKMLFA